MSLLLANLFLHYTFDAWMQRTYPQIPFERHADDALCHCRTSDEAEGLKAALGQILRQLQPGDQQQDCKGDAPRGPRLALQLRSDKDLDDLARMFNAVIRGWVNYYGALYKSALYPTLQHLDRKLARWATRKFKRLRCHRRRAEHWLRRIARRQPGLFAHWRLLYGQVG